MKLLSRIRVAGSLEEAVASANYVQESVPENLTLKKSLFSDIDRLARPDAVLASSTSELPPSGFLSHLRGRARCLVAHPLNPPHLIPAIEICPAPFTSSSALQDTIAMLQQVGQRPLLVRYEINGFVMNRLQIAVLQESLSLVERGVCSVADLDIAMKYGLARRWAVMGPFETNYLSTEGDYGHFLEVYGPTLKSIADDLHPVWEFGGTLGGRIDAELNERLHGEAREATAARRDRNLARLAKQGIEN
jgi:3-hydroxyacyl-CoA dehydrogenase